MSANAEISRQLVEVSRQIERLRVDAQTAWQTLIANSNPNVAERLAELADEMSSRRTEVDAALRDLLHAAQAARELLERRRELKLALGGGRA